MQHAADSTYQHTTPTRARSKTGITLALVLAVAVHILVLLLPLPSNTEESVSLATVIEVQLTAFTPPQQRADISESQAVPEPLPTAQPTPLPEPEQTDKPVPEQAAAITENIAASSPEPALTSINRDVEQMNRQEKSRLTSSILSRQFITEPSASEQVFGKPLPALQEDPLAEFHYPQRQSMVTMLDKPMQELPFEYEEGLVYFAYAPGVKGDLQKFWDDITPEFGWITKHGTEVKCVWILIIGGCAWK